MSIITLKQKKDLIISIFGKGIVSNNEKDIAVSCPVCKKVPGSKNKKKLSISIENGIYHCWVCESKGRSLTRFIRKNVSNFKNIEKVIEYFGQEKEEKIEEDIETLNLPEDFQLIATSNSRTSNFIKKYLIKRGLDTSDFYKFKIGYSFDFQFTNRIIFPSFDKNLDLNFYVSRIYNEENNIKYGKYKNCNASKKDIIFNEHQLDWNSPIVIVEGIFDSVKAGQNSVPILGSWLDQSYHLFREIVDRKADVIICLDPDAKEKEVKIAKKFLEYGINVKTISHISTDLGDLDKKEVKNLIDNAKPFDNIKRMRYLISGIKSGSMY